MISNNNLCFKISFFIILIIVCGCTDDEEHYGFRLDSTHFEYEELETINFTISEFDDNSNGFLDRTRRTKIMPKQSALVLIDVWQRDFLDTITINNINPLIEDFRAKGSKIIYSPSQEPQNENLLIVDDGMHFLDLDRMDPYLKENNIETLFYVGFDTFHCILDKPNGIYGTKKRNKNVQIFVLEEGVMSFTKEMKETSISLLKKNGVGLIEASDSLSFDFPQETLTDIYAKTKSTTNIGNHFVLVFENNSNHQELTKFKDKISLLDIPFGIVKNEKLQYENRELSSEEFHLLLQELEIKNLYYTGSYLNNEIIWSKFGVLPLYIKIRYEEVKGLPWPYVINDLVYMSSNGEIDENLEKATILNHYRMIHNISSTTFLNKMEEEFEVKNNSSTK